MFLPVWAGAIVYVAEIVLIVLANILLYDKGIYYVPIVEFIIFISGTFYSIMCIQTAFCETEYEESAD